MEMIATEDINYILAPLPTTIRGFVHENDDGSYTVVLNDRLTREANVISAYHELEHVLHEDFSQDKDVDQIEAERHRR